MAYYDFLNIVFAALLKMPPLLAVLAMAFIVSLIIIAVTKYTTNQELMKKLKEDMKNYQKQAKELKSNPSKAMEVQKKAMEVNMHYMMHSLRPTLITFIPIILIFGWMNSVFAYESINPQEQFGVTAIFDKNAEGSVELFAPEGTTLVGEKVNQIENNRATWSLKGTEGRHVLEFRYNNKTYQKEALITNENKYIEPIKKINDGTLQTIQINYKKRTLIPIGYKDWLGWLGTYIWSSIAFTMILRKLLKVY